MGGWTADDMPDLTGQTAVVTGANSGLGKITARELARHGSRVILACRSPERGQQALDELRAADPEATLELMTLDLSDLDSVQQFAEAFPYPKLDLLINNAGVMALPYRTTAQGFEMQIGTNHFGHFALTGRLFDKLEAAPAARVVNLSSQAHRMGSVRWHDLQWVKLYQRWLAYGQSKLCNLLFAFEAARRLGASGSSVASVAAHPGYSSTHLQLQGAELDGNALKAWGMGMLNGIFAQPAEMGALPTLYAATHEEVVSGDYIGPDGPGEWWGHPRKVSSSRRARDEEAGARLWDVSQELTGVRYL